MSEPTPTNAYNPILWVENLTTGVTHNDIPCPSTYEWQDADTSASDAGRTEDNVMHKKQIGEVEGLNLGWQNLTDAEAHKVLTAFHSEYVRVKFKDPLVGTALNGYTNTLVFYSGDRHAAMYNNKLGIWSSISFSIIDRNGVTKS